jgi:signal transduction histidine kinase
MESVVRLNEAFRNFTRASESLESCYRRLNERVQYLTGELEKKNALLNRAIADVERSKDYLQAVLQSIGEAMIVLDRDGKINMINSAAEKLLSVTAEQVTGMNWDQLGFSLSGDVSGEKLSVGGKEYDVIFSRSEVPGEKGSARGYVLLLKDVSRLKELERQNERNQRLIAMGEMAAKIVHEIRSPLCSIELFSNMLSGDLEGTRHSELASGISSGIKSLNNILTNMLLFARPHKPSLKPLSIEESIDESVEMLRPLIESRGILIRRSYIPHVINGDGELLKQVFMNIILNAVHAMTDGGTIEIRMETEDNFLKVMIIDEGKGIDEELIEKIFDPFFTTKDRGTGLGLAIAHRIMLSHNGFISASSNKDSGSTFTLSFPIPEHFSLTSNPSYEHEGAA